MTPSPIRVLLVDDHAVVRAGYRRFLEHSRMMEVVGEAGTSDEAYQMFRLLKPDVVVMDISLPGASGIEAARRMIALDGRARVLMFSMHAQPAFARQALEAGAIGFLTKDTEPDTLVQAVLAAAQGRRTLRARVAEQLALDNVMPDERRLDVLTPREFEICRLLLAGMTVDEIADTLKLSPKTISNRMSEIRQKLDVRSDVELVRLATAAGLVPWAARPGIEGEAAA